MEKIVIISSFDSEKISEEIYKKVVEEHWLSSVRSTGGALSKVSDWNSFRVNQNYSDSFRYLYPSQCESFRSWIHSDWFWLKIWFGSIQNRIDWDWSVLKTWFRIHLHWCYGTNRIKSDWILTIFRQMRYKCF